MLVVPSVLGAGTVRADGALCTRIATVSAEEGWLPTQGNCSPCPVRAAGSLPGRGEAFYQVRASTNGAGWAVSPL
jgi:hypothetical protein